MDIPRPKKTDYRRWALGGAGLAAVLATSVALARLQPASPTVERSGIYTDTVQRGTFVREVRGPGTLVPEQIRFISAVTAGRVEKIMAEPGLQVDSQTVLLRLSNPDVQLQAMEAQRQVAGAEASMANLRATLENQRLNQEAAVATAQSQYNEALRQATANRELAKRGLIPEMELAKSNDAVKEFSKRLEIEKKRLSFIEESNEAQLKAQKAEIARLRGLSAFQQHYVESLKVTAGTRGVLRELPLQEGQWVNPGDRLAVVVQPGRLKAELKIPETQAKDVVVGQKASIDTRNGIVPGRVTRIYPAVENGTVTVEVALEGPLPKGARPDLSVDGTIEIERLSNVLFVGRPAFGQPESTVGLFELEPDGEHARRVQVQLGRASVNTIEIRKGLEEGDVVILSDMSQWDATDRVRLK
ncbi:MAG TPA: HlyD family efflux transporter periplasmic adaptor subunit [Longimicrobiaceae bacterium]|nr:HlyD family efflux transporter periplasmic adaptor subunit [Longimicrobiaceae bacterium]